MSKKSDYLLFRGLARLLSHGVPDGGVAAPKFVKVAI